MYMYVPVLVSTSQHITSAKNKLLHVVTPCETDFIHYWTIFLDVCTWSFQEGHRYSRRLPGTMVRCKHCSRTILHLTSFCGQIKTLFLIFKWVKKITFIQFLIFFTKTLVTKIFQDASCFQIAIYLKAHQSSNHITTELETLLHVHRRAIGSFFQMQLQHVLDIHDCYNVWSWLSTYVKKFPL